MENDDAAQILNGIGQTLTKAFGKTPEGLLLYAELDTNMVGPSVFELRNREIQYHWPPDDLTYPLLDLWELGEPGKRWFCIEYVIRDGAFKATFTYPEDADPDEDEGRRRDRIVWRNFGQLPIVYPPWPDDANEDFKLT